MSKGVKYYSTNGKAPVVAFREALLKGLAPDGGLYLPDHIPVFSGEELEGFRKKDYHIIATEILRRFIGDEVRPNDLERLCSEAYNFEVPVEKVYYRKHILRLDQGPTASFKDFAARMMSRLMQNFLAAENKQLTILTATSGDTGSAVASSFYGLENTNVIILFPADEVTDTQRKQMTTLHKNITVIAVDGKFDDCQHMVKKAFIDPALSHIPLSSANSINIGRLLPQTVYYFYAWAKLAIGTDDNAIFSVPSGNFGNLTAGLLASRMGLPVGKFIISTNSNDEVPEFLRSGIYKPVIPSRNCISSAMNVGHPSNLARIVALYGGMMNEKGKLIRKPDMNSMSGDLFGVSVSDDETRNTIEKIYRDHKVILEPHGAIAWRGILEYLNNDKQDLEEQLFISLETAHPAKFPNELKKVLGFTPPLPPSMTELEGKKENFLTADNNYQSLKKIILQGI